MMKHAPEYIKGNGSAFEEFDRVSYTVIDVLSFLRGKPWDDVALGYVHALRPSSIRISHGETKCDGRTWRVTVFLDEAERIESIEQEVEVGLPDNVEDGYELDGISGGG